MPRKSKHMQLFLKLWDARVAELRQSLEIWLQDHNAGIPSDPENHFPNEFAWASGAMLETAIDRFIYQHGEARARELIEIVFRDRAKLIDARIPL